MANIDPWHFPRREFAHDLVQQLGMGLAPRLTLVAPQRKGKTEFPFFDLAPAAQQAGYEVVYTSLRANVKAPQHGLLDALGAAVESRSDQRSVTRKVMDAAVNKVKVDAMRIGAELEFADKPVRTSGDDLSAIDRAIEQLSLGKKSKLLLTFDEIRHLATERTFLATTFKEVTRREINEAFLWEQFVRLDCNPFYVREALKLMALEPELSLASAMERLLSAIADQNDYPGLRSRMSIVDQAIFIEVTRNPEGGGLRGRKFLDELARITGKPVSRGYIGHRLQRLVDGNLISAVRRGSYQVEMPGFVERLLWEEEGPRSGD